MTDAVSAHRVHHVTYVAEPPSLECVCGWHSGIASSGFGEPTAADAAALARRHLIEVTLSPAEVDALELSRGVLPRGWACTLATTPENIRWVAENIAFGLTAANYPELSPERLYALRCRLDRIGRRGHDTREARP